MDPTKIVYEAEIQGHEDSQWKWVLYREGGPYPKRVAIADCSGIATTFETACEAATDCAQEIERKRRHAAAKETVVVLEVPFGAPEKTDMAAIETALEEPIQSS